MRKIITTMTRCIILVLIAYNLSYAYVNGQDNIKNTKVSINLKDATLVEIFSTLSTLTPYKFAYGEYVLNYSEKFTVANKDHSLGSMLDNLGKRAFFDIHVQGENILIKKKKLKRKSPPPLPTLSIQVSGTVTDENGVPMPGASVVIKGTSKGTITDVNGNFSLKVQEDATLVVSFLGYADQEVMVSGRSIIDVQMVVYIQSLDEVVVVGYGTTTKRDLTGSVSSVEEEDLSSTQYQSLDQRLSGLMAGVQVTSTGGAPGSHANIYIRGLNTFQGANQPLYVVDGIPINVAPRVGRNSENFGFLGDATDRDFRNANPLLAIHPDNIERIDVLKDASATAIYGSRASYGVVLVTTKQGKMNTRPKINFTMTTSLQNPLNKYKALNAQQYKAYIKKMNPTLNLKDSDFGNSDTDWQDLITNHNALMTQYSASLMGGTDSERYFLSGSATNHQGVLKDNRLKRYTLSARINSKVVKKINVGTSINYNYTINRSSNITSLKDGVKARPDKGVYDKDGSYSGDSLSSFFGSKIFVRNPIGNAENYRSESKNHYFMGTLFGEYELAQNLTFKSQISVSVSSVAGSIYDPRHTRDSQLGQQSLLLKPPYASLATNASSTNTTEFANTLSYIRKWASKHSINGVAGISWTRNRYELTVNSYLGFPDDKILVNPSSSIARGVPIDDTSIDALHSMFGRINYSYDGRYLLTFTARRDGSTKFGTQNRYGFFPSGAIAWHLEKEKFLSDIYAISNLKLRISVGRTGSDNLPSFTYSNYVGTVSGVAHNSNYKKSIGIVPLRKPNPKIRWEETTQWDVGLELGLFDQRLHAEIVYFVKNTSGIIIKGDIPYQHGFAKQHANLADISNKGWEITIGGDILKYENFRWTSSVNISFIRNRVESFNGGDFGLGSDSERIRRLGIGAGKPLGHIFGHKVLRIAQTQKEIDELNKKAPGGVYDNDTVRPGDYIMKDINGDGKITRDDITDLGSINPDYFGGWVNRLHYKNFDFSFHFQFVQGSVKKWNVASNFLTPLPYGERNSSATTAIYDTWSPKNTHAHYSRLIPNTTLPRRGRSENNSREVFDNSYIRLRSVSLGYRFPKVWFEKMPFSSVKLSISANNLLTITQYPGLDPENGTRNSPANPTRGNATDYVGDSGNDYPMVKSYVAKVQVTF